MSNYGDYTNKQSNINFEPTKEKGTTPHLSTSQSTLEHTVAGRQATKSSPSLFSKFRGLFRRSSSGIKTAEEASSSQSRHKITVQKPSSTLSKVTSFLTNKKPLGEGLKNKGTSINTNTNMAPMTQTPLQKSLLDATSKNGNNTMEISDAFKNNPKNLENIGKVDRNEIDGLLPLYKTPEGREAIEIAANKGFYNESTNFLNDYVEIEEQLNSFESSQDPDKLSSLQAKLYHILDFHIADNKVNIEGSTQQDLMEFRNKSITKEDIPNIKKLLEKVKVETCKMVVPLFNKTPEFKELKSATSQV